MKTLLDTCIIIDALQSRVPFCKEAQEIFLFCADNTVEGFVTAKEVTDIYYLIHRQLHNDGKTREILRKISTLFFLLDTTSLDIQKAISSQSSDFGDAVMMETALRSDMDCIVTRNKEDYVLSEIPVYTPTEFLRLLKMDFSHDGM